MSLRQHIDVIKIVGFRQWLRGWRDHPAVWWCERVSYCHHNARVLADMEYRMSCVLSEATGGLMSKSYYTTDTMIAEINDNHGRIYDEGYEEGFADAKLSGCDS